MKWSLATEYQTSKAEKAQRKVFQSAMAKMKKYIKAGKTHTSHYAKARAIVAELDGEENARILENWFKS